MFRFSILAAVACLIVSSSGCQPGSPYIDPQPIASSKPDSGPVATSQQAADPNVPDAVETVDPATDSRKLFDGVSLDGWKSSRFGGDGEVAVVDGEIDIESGNPKTGITWTGDPMPTDNYRISLEAKRTAGIDFFCCLTFPVRQSHCSFVVAGWSGTVVGLSCVDGQDASNNDTTTLKTFDDNRWYRIEVEVGNDSIQAWIDGERVIEQPILGHEFTVRNDIVLSVPLGICTFETDARIRNIVTRRTQNGKSD